MADPHDNAKIVRLTPHLLRAAHLRVLIAAVDQAQMAFDDAEVLAAAGRFFGRQPFASGEALHFWLDEHDAHPQFLPWLLWDAGLTTGPGEADLTRRLRRACTSPVERTVLKALRATQADVYTVTAVDQKITTMRRLRDGQMLAVHEPVLRAMAAPGEIFVARVVEIGKVQLLDAVHASLPTQCHEGMLRAAKRAETLPVEQKLPSLLRAASKGLEKIQPDRPQPGTASARLHWTLAFSIDNTERVLEVLRRAVQEGRLARLSPKRFAVLDGTLGPIGATVRVSGTRLYAATSAPGAKVQARAAAVQGLRDGLAQLLDLQPQATLVRDLEPLFNPRRRNKWTSSELQSVAREWIGECLTGFQDTAQPWLDGATPREAVRTADGRLRVRAWLHHVEQVSEVAGPGYNGAVQRLWKELAERDLG